MLHRGRPDMAAALEMLLARRTRQDSSDRSLSDAEISVLKLLWADGPMTVSQVHERLVEDGGTWAYPTVQTLLHRMLDKHCVARQRAGRNQIYSATVEREDIAARAVDQVASQYFDGARLPILKGLLTAGDLSPEEIAELRKMVTEAGRERRGRGR